MTTLLWTSDSPFCRIALWSMALLGRDTEFELQHLTWDELRKISAGEKLGTAATVPCLSLSSGECLSDSLRILAYLLRTDFFSWFLSSEGELYRIVEGQFARVMYALYDGAQGKSLEKVHGQWRRALHAAELGLVGKGSQNSLPGAALHVFVCFCLKLQPEWRNDISEPLASLLSQQENTAAFAKLKSWVAATDYRVPCYWAGPER
ncbi:MAG: hypothetical protein FJY29_01000 [Betaproteobacteria bacterium]|nr:hypothetical protein [Betaproteobacteria bacterium]